MVGLNNSFSSVIPVARDEVFEALVRAERLRQWFCEDADVEAEAGGRYRFWGRSSIATRNAEQAMQKIASYEPPVTFSFTWRVLGHDSLVVVTLRDVADAEAPQTRLEVEQSFETAPEVERPLALIDDFWRLHCGNLMLYLVTGQALPLPDFDDPEPEIRQSVVIEAPRERVFAALTEPELLKAWFWATDPQVEPRVGGRYSLGWRYEHDGREVCGGPTTILELAENERLVTDWPDWRGDPAVPAQRVTWDLEDLDGKTRVTVAHDGFTRTADFSDYPSGWAEFLRQLKICAESLNSSDA